MLVRRIKRIFNRCAKRAAKDLSLGLYFPAVYRKAAQEPVDQAKVVFLESKSAQLPDAYKILYEKLVEETSFDVRFVSLGQNRVRLRQYYYNCRDAVKEVATAKYVFLNDASDLISCLPLRDETKAVQLWHACGAFKKWGMSTADLKFGGTRRDLLRHPFYKNLSLVTVSSPEVVWAYIEAMVLEDRPEIVKALGVSRTDAFFDEDYLSEARDRVERLVPSVHEKRVILYAPTFRGRVATAEGPDELDIAGFQRAFGKDSVLLIKHHPFVKKPHEIPEGCQEFAFDVSGDLDIADLLCVADVCISDYSSLVFEYSLFGRPMAFFAYDKEDYDDWRGFYYDYEELTPGPVFSSNDEMIDYIENIEDRFDASRVQAFRDKFMSACDGQATERICNEVFGEAYDQHRKPSVSEVLDKSNSSGIDVSVVVPAYNAMPEFTKALESLVCQTYDLSRMEVIVVDDCSTDATWDEARRFARLYPDLFVLERLEEPSGSPAKPRNVGMEKARGAYVFFLDADDWLGEKAIEKMLRHAVEWNSDVLLVKMKGENGRDVPKSMFTHNQPDADVFSSKVMWSFAPLKLFRRSLVKDLRFPSFMPEDIPFVLRAYCLARTVSVAADYEYYHVSQHEEDRHISLTTWSDVESNVCAYEDIFRFVEACIPEEARDEVLMRRLFRRDVCNSLVSAAQEDGGAGEVHMLSLVDLARPYYREAMYKTCPVPKRLILDAAFFGDVRLLARVVSEGEGLAARSSYDVENGRIVCRIPENAGSLSCDVSDALSLGCRVEHASERNGALSLRGTITIPESFADAACSLMLEREKDGMRVDIPANSLRMGERIEVQSGIPSLSAVWELSLPLARLFELEVDSEWRLALLLRVRGWEKEARLGPVRNAGVKLGYTSIKSKQEDKKLSTCLGSRGDMCVRIKKAR